MVRFHQATSLYPSQYWQIYVAILRHGVLSNCHNISGDLNQLDLFPWQNRYFLPYGVMNLVNNGPGNGLLSDGAKPLPDSIMTSHLYVFLRLISIQVMTYIDDENKFECIIFKMSPSLNELIDLSGKSMYVQTLLTLTEGNIFEFIMNISIWNLSM